MRTVAERMRSLVVGNRRREEKTERLEQQKVWVDKLLDTAEGGAGMLHLITKPRPWRGGAQVSENVFEDTQPLE